MAKTNIILHWIIVFSCIFLCGSCHESRPPGNLLEMFPEPTQLNRVTDAFVDKDSLAVVEGLDCQGKHLVVYDFWQHTSYTLLDAYSGEFITRFGKIGQGPSEILLGCYGSLVNGHFTVFSDQSHLVMDYDLDSLREKKEGYIPTRLMTYDLKESYLSRLARVGQGRFLGAGTHQSKFQYVLFDEQSQVIDSAVEIYNSDDPSFDKYTKFLSNQGTLAVHPDGSLMAYSLNFSSNIDFIEVKNDNITLLTSLRMGNPAFKSNTSADGRMFSADLTEQSIVGYIDLCASRSNLYALYSDKSAMESARKSSTVLVYNWQGEPTTRYSLDAVVYAIAVDSEGKRLFASFKDDDRNWSIAVYELP